MFKTLLVAAALACAVVSTNSHKASRTKLHLLEGDMLVTEEQDKVTNSKEGLDDLQKRAKMKRKRKGRSTSLWEGGVVPYVIDKKLDKIKDRILSAIEEVHNLSCVRWVKRKKQTDWVRFSADKHRCASFIGKSKLGGEQLILLGPRCASKGIILHEMLHAMGFWHEQSRLDRNRYVKVLFQNIVKGSMKNFKKYPHTRFDVFRFPYDTKSLMHYPNFAFSKNGAPTIVATSNSMKRLGQLQGLSPLDTDQLNCLYCSSTDDYGSKCKRVIPHKPLLWMLRYKLRAS